MTPIVKTPMIFCMVSLYCSTSNQRKQNQMYQIEDNITLKINNTLKPPKGNSLLP